MGEMISQDDKTLIEFWDKAFVLSEEELAEESKADTEGWKEIAPSKRLFEAACLLGQRKRVLDYGCGSAWASIIAAKSGCTDVSAADAAPGAVKAAEFYAKLYGVEDRVNAFCVGTDWLKAVPDESFDGFICSNVLDVVPSETAEAIIRGAARVVTPDALVLIGMNYYLPPEAAAEKGLKLEGGMRLYVDGVLRLVSRSDEEWTQIFAPWFAVEKLEHFAWPGETKETRRLFYLRKV